MKLMKYIRWLIPVFLVVQIWTVYITFTYPYLGIVVFQNEQGQWQVNEFQKKSEGSNLVHKGDIVLSIDGQEPGDYFTVKKWKGIEQAGNIVVERDGGRIYSVDTRNLPHPVAPGFIYLLAELLSIGFALLLMKKAGKSKSARLLALVFINIALLYMNVGASERGDTLAKVLISNFMPILPFVFLKFLIEFFREKTGVHCKDGYLRFLYPTLTVIFVLRFSLFLPNADYGTYQANFIAIAVFLLIGLILNFWLLISIYYRYAETHAYLAMILRTVMFSLFISFFPVVGLTFLPQVLFQQEIGYSFYNSWFVHFFPMSFAYLILSKQIYDIEIILRRLLYTTIISIIPSVVLTAVITGLLYKDTHLEKILLTFITILLVMSVLIYSLEYLATKLEKIMFPRKYYLQTALKKVAKDLEVITSFRELKEIVLVDIVNTLQVHGAAFVIQYPNDIEVIGEGMIDPTEVENQFNNRSWNEMGYTVAEINKHEEYNSYLVLTRKKTNTYMNREELQWLNLIITYLSVSMENLYLIRKLHMRLHELASELPNQENGGDYVWFRKTMFELQEKERTRIASDLHDTTMQDIFFVIRKLKSLQKQLTQTEDLRQIRDILNHLELINVNLRQCCFELNPYMLKNIGLIGALRNLIDIESGLGSYEIQLITSGNLEEIEQMEDEKKRHIFRMIQELITNGRKHARADHLNIKLQADKGQLLVMYEDDGIGFQTESVASKVLGKSGMGLEQMKSRSLHLNGLMDISSEKGSGVRISIKIPVKEGVRV